MDGSEVETESSGICDSARCRVNSLRVVDASTFPILVPGYI